MPFTGNAPDLGAYEFGAATSVEMVPIIARKAAALRIQETAASAIFDLSGRRIPIKRSDFNNRLVIYRNNDGITQAVLLISR